jgi:hypothetical protein
MFFGQNLNVVWNENTHPTSRRTAELLASNKIVFGPIKRRNNERSRANNY